MVLQRADNGRNAEINYKGPEKVIEMCSLLSFVANKRSSVIINILLPSCRLGLLSVCGVSRNILNFILPIVD